MVKYKNVPKVKNIYKKKRDDKRFKRSNHLLDFPCPKCTNISLKEKKESNYVWSYCTTCGISGESNKIKDHHLIAACDIYYTVVDSLSV